MIVVHAAHNGSVTMEGAGIDCGEVMSGLVVVTAFWVSGSSVVEWHSPRRQFSVFANTTKNCQIF